MGVKPLTVAVIAMGLLVVSVGFEVLVHRTYAIDLRVGDTWRTIGESVSTSEPYRMKPVGATDPVRANASDAMTFRIRVDNGYPWAFREHYFVTAWSGVTVADGELTAPGRSYGEATFTVTLGRIMQDATFPREGNASTLYRTANLNVLIGNVYLSGSFDIEEVR